MFGALGRLSFSLLAWGEAGLFSVCALGRLTFQFRIPTKPRIRTLAKMSSFSLSLLHLQHLDKWQLAKCEVISSMHSVTNTFSSTPLPGPHSVYDLAEELLDEIAEKAIFHNWSLSRFHWHNYIWNWHLLHYNSIRLKPKQDHLRNTDVIPWQKLKTEIIPFACIHWKKKLFFPVPLWYR